MESEKQDLNNRDLGQGKKNRKKYGERRGERETEDKESLHLAQRTIFIHHIFALALQQTTIPTIYWASSLVTVF